VARHDGVARAHLDQMAHGHARRAPSMVLARAYPSNAPNHVIGGLLLIAYLLSSLCVPFMYTSDNLSSNIGISFCYLDISIIFRYIGLSSVIFLGIWIIADLDNYAILIASSL
jgi:hypothetical protein